MLAKKFRTVLRRTAKEITEKLVLSRVITRDSRSSRLTLNLPRFIFWSYSAVLVVEGLKIFPPFTLIFRTEATFIVVLIAICAIGVNASGPTEESSV